MLLIKLLLRTSSRARNDYVILKSVQLLQLEDEEAIVAMTQLYVKATMNLARIEASSTLQEGQHAFHVLCLLYFICQISSSSIKKTAWLMSHAELLKRFSLHFLCKMLMVHEMVKLQQMTLELLIVQTKHQLTPGAVDWTDNAPTDTGAVNWTDNAPIDKGAVDWTDNAPTDTGAVDWTDNAPTDTGAVDWTDNAPIDKGAVDWTDDAPTYTGAVDWTDNAPIDTGAVDWTDNARCTALYMLN